MCIIAYKPANVKIPKDFIDTLEHCFDNNPDGAGIMHRRDGEIWIQKGFMTFKSFKKGYERMEFTDKDSFVLHFRIATHGGIDTHTCHPFPISGDVRELRATMFHTNFAMAHNGCISLADEDDSLSDSMLFVRDVVAKIEPEKIYNDDAIQKMMVMATPGSKLLLWHIEHGILLTGKWEEVGGIKYSNDTYKKSEVTYVSWKDDWFGSYNRSKKKANTGLVDTLSSSNYDYMFNEDDDTGECVMCGVILPKDELTMLFGEVVCEDCYNTYGYEGC